MIIGIEGTVEHKEPTVIHVNVSGIIYEVFISLQSASLITEKKVKLHTSHIIREDAQLLYGFIDKTEKVLFERLIKISGVGPKVGMAICSTFSASDFGKIISNGDIAGLKKVPGIGPKSAGRILVELNGFDTELLEGGSSFVTSSASEATQALESLGFKKEHIIKALKGCESTDTAILVKEALRKLQKI
jgi:Holliday junction DNA helicase RuvA